MGRPRMYARVKLPISKIVQLSKKQPELAELFRSYIPKDQVIASKAPHITRKQIAKIRQALAQRGEALIRLSPNKAGVVRIEHPTFYDVKLKFPMQNQETAKKAAASRAKTLAARHK